MSNKEEDGSRVARMKDLLSIGGGPGRGGPGLILPKPKPKPKPNPAPEFRGMDQSDGRTISISPPSSPRSPDQMEDPGPILLNTDSLRQFSDTLEYDFDAVVRQQILDSTAQKDRAALSQSKGLQNRRLPSNIAGKVPEDYSERRRANTYSGNIRRAVKQPMEDSVDGPEMSEEERKQKNLAKLGVQQGNNPLAGLANLLKRNSSGRGSFSKKAPKSPQKLQGSPVVPPKKKKKSLEVPASPIPARLGSEPPQSLPKSPKSFLRGLRRNSSRSKKKTDGDDLASETSSIVSLPIHTSLDETPQPMDITPTVSPIKSAEKPRATNGVSPAPAVSKNGGFAPMHTSSPAQLVPLRDKTSTSPSAHRKTTDSAIFKEGSYEPLFGSTSNLFDSRELDALMGKKKEKTPDREAKVSKENGKPDGVSVSPIAKRKVNEKKTNGPLIAIHPAQPTPGPLIAIHPAQPTPEKKRSVDSPRSGIRANLHRYASNSSVSKSSITSDSGIKEDLKMESVSESVGESVTEERPKKPTISPEPRKKASLLFEECDDDLFGPAKTDEASTDKPVDVRKASLFDDDDELFSTDRPSRKRETSPAFLQDSKLPEPSKKKSQDSLGAEVEKKDVGAVLEDAKPKDSVEIGRKSKEDVLEDTETRRKSKEILESIDIKVEEKKGAVTVAEMKEKDEVDFFGSPKEEKKTDDIFGDALFDDITTETKTKSPKHASLFDEDKSSPSLFIREHKALRTNADKGSHISDSDDLFTDISPKTSPKMERAKMVDVTDVDSFDPLGAIDVQISSEVEKSYVTGVKSRVSTASPSEDAKEDQLPDLVMECGDVAEDSKAATKEDSKMESVTSKQSTGSSKVNSKAAGSDSKTAGRKVESGSSHVSKESDKEKTGKPAWMAELKKRKAGEDSTAAPATAPKKKEPVEPPMPEWKKKALERKKKAKSGEGSSVSSQIAKKKEPAEAPVPEWKKTALERKKKAEVSDPKSKVGRTSPAKSPVTSRKAAVKTPVNGRSSPQSSRKSPNVSATEALQSAEKKEVSKSPLTSSYKTRSEREKEEKKEKEKEEDVKGETAKKEDTDTSEVKPRYKTRREREREEKEKEEKSKEESTKKEDPESSEVKSHKEEKVKEEKSKKAETESSDVKPRYKTRQERAKEREELKKKADAEVAELRSRYRAKREKEKEERAKEEQEKPRYKTRREREQEEKEKKEKERGQEKDSATTETNKTTAKESEDIPSPTTKSKPVLSKKPSIEIISRKKMTSRSSDAGDDGKSSQSSQVEDAQSSKKVDTDDDVFSAGDALEQRSTSNLSLRRTPSPKVSLDTLTLDGGVVENGQHDKDTNEGKNLTITTTSTVSPTHVQNGSTSSKSSVSSDRDLMAEPKPARSQTISLSSRSPTPPKSSAESLPEWKRQLMERKKSSSSPVHKNAPKTVELPSTDSNIPQWKKDLLAKKKLKPDDPGASSSPRANRSATVSVPSSSRAKGKEPAPTPDFMKEFQKKKLHNS